MAIRITAAPGASLRRRMSDSVRRQIAKLDDIHSSAFPLPRRFRRSAYALFGLQFEAVLEGIHQIDHFGLGTRRFLGLRTKHVNLILFDFLAYAPHQVFA